ncbi:hypothetical protein XENOCAPTIV_028529, partial [Xenoophorus captivus]
LICDFLALKNDISSWRKKKNMAGMSRKSVLWRCLGTLLIFLHLLEETSLLVLLPVGLGACVEVPLITGSVKLIIVKSIRKNSLNSIILHLTRCGRCLKSPNSILSCLLKRFR